MFVYTGMWSQYALGIDSMSIDSIPCDGDIIDIFEVSKWVSDGVICQTIDWNMSCSHNGHF